LTLAVRAPQESETKIATTSASQGKKKIAEVSGMYTNLSIYLSVS
jgi:translation initiation factor eIF-2B subunit delta